MSAQGKGEQQLEQVEKVAHHWVSAGQRERIWIVGGMGDIVQMEFVIAGEVVSMKVGRDGEVFDVDWDTERGCWRVCQAED